MYKVFFFFVVTLSSCTELKYNLIEKNVYFNDANVDAKKGVHVICHPDSSVVLLVSIENNVFNGKVKIYNYSNKTITTGKYKNGKKEGTWILYNSNGTIERKMVYFNDSITQIFVYKDGKIQKSMIGLPKF